MYRFHRYNLIRWDIYSPSIAYKLFVRGLYDYVIVKEETSSSVTTRSYFVGVKSLETNWSNRASLTYSTNIKGRKLVNEGQNWLAAAIGQITELLTGVNYRVEDYPLVWIEDTYYTTYKDDIFQVSVKTDVPTQTEYDAVTSISLNSQSLTTDFTGTLLGKFTNLEDLYIDANNIDLIDISHNPNIVRAVFNSNVLSTIIFDNSVNSKLRNFNLAVNTLTGSIDLTGLTLLETFFMHYNSITSVTLPSAIGNKLSFMNVSFNQLTDLDLSNSPLLTAVYTQNNNLTAATNSQMLINLDGFGLSNGIFQGSIFGGGSLTAAGQIAKVNLQAKGWNIIGI